MSAVPPQGEPARLPEALSAWSNFQLPGKRRTEYLPAVREGRRCLLAQARHSASLLRIRLAETQDTAARVEFDWWIGQHSAVASASASESDDAPARVLLGFEGDEARLSFANRMKFELVRALTGEAPPFATLMYVWDAKAAPGSVIISGHTDRIRKIVLGGSAAQMRRWLSFQRDVGADFRLAFGEAPGRLSSVAIMTDADNTTSQSEACYGGLFLRNVQGQALSGSWSL